MMAAAILEERDEGGVALAPAKQKKLTISDLQVGLTISPALLCDPAAAATTVVAATAVADAFLKLMPSKQREIHYCLDAAVAVMGMDINGRMLPTTMGTTMGTR
jgi:hypothetical protein